MELGAELNEFLAGYGAKPWSWGHVDCGMAMVDWAIARGRLDAATGVRGTYTSEAEYAALMHRWGGLLPLVSDCFGRIGLEAVTSPAAGVIGVIGSRHRALLQWGAIHDGRRWQVRTEDGFRALIAAPLAMWKV